jgi:hypothetical protein
MHCVIVGVSMYLASIDRVSSYFAYILGNLDADVAEQNILILIFLMLFIGLLLLYDSHFIVLRIASN